MHEGIIFLAPHNDDEALFGAYILMHRKLSKPTVVVCTDSWIQFNRGTGITAEHRRDETLAAMKILGCETEFLGIKDTELVPDKLKGALKKYKPSKVYAPKPNSKHPHHNIVGDVAYKLWPDKVVFYSTYTATNLSPEGEFEVIPIDEDEAEIKSRMLACYKSQLEVNRPHFDAVYGKSEFLNLTDETPKISVVLLKWKRPEEIEEIKEFLRTITFVGEILTWTNTEESNKMSYGSYLGAKQAENDIIFIQDDDVICRNIGELYASFDGEHLSTGLKFTAYPGYANQKGDEPYSTLVGWGAMFKKEWISVFDKYIEKYGEDHVLFREAGRIFTTLLARRHNIIPVLWQDFPSAIGEMALYRQPDHYEYRDVAIKRAMEITRDGI